MPKHNTLLVLILVITAILNLAWISSGDPVNDEVFMSFRGLGMMDFDEAEAQTTPWEWWDPSTNSGQVPLTRASSEPQPNSSGQVRGIPWWAKLSFHDHPLLAPLTQNIFMKIFGENAFGFRLPSALLGIASVYLVYLIGRRLFSVNAGLFSAGLFGVTLNHIYISRTGMQEPYVIFFLLLASYLFLGALKDDRFLIWTGAILGLGFLAKYNVFILVPIFLIYLLFFKRDYFLNKKLWLGALLALLIFSPVIIYNIGLYLTAGHFDFQFSYIFGQNPEVWKVAPGKEIGTLWDRAQDFVPRLIATNSWVFLSFFAVAALAHIISFLKEGIFSRSAGRGASPAPEQARCGINGQGSESRLRDEESERRNPAKTHAGSLNGSIEKKSPNLFSHAFLVIAFVWLIILLLKIGPSYRFLTMLTPFFALSAGSFLDAFRQKPYSNVLKNIGIRIVRNLAWGILAIILAFEIFYSVNNQILNYPIGPTPWLASKVRYENYNWGYNQLSGWLEKELKGKLPALTFDMKYQFLEDLREKALDKGLAQGLKPYPALFIYEGNFDKAAKLWILDRLHIYHAWPIISFKTHLDYLQENGPDYYERVGFRNFYFIFQPNIVPSPVAFGLMRGELISIKNPRGEEAFQIYKF